MSAISDLFTKDIAIQVSQDAAKEVSKYLSGTGKDSITKVFSENTSAELTSFFKLKQEAQKRRLDIQRTKIDLSKSLNNPLLLNRHLIRYQAALTKAYVFVQETGNFITKTNFIYSFLFESGATTNQHEVKIANLDIKDIIPALQISFGENGVRLTLTNLNVLKAIERNIVHQTDTEKLIGNLYLNLLYSSGGGRRLKIVDSQGKHLKLTGRGRKGLAFEAAMSQVIESGTKNLSSAALDLTMARETAARVKNNPAPFYTGKDTEKGLRSLGGSKTRMELKKFELDQEWYGAGLTGEQTILRALLKIEDIIDKGGSVRTIQKNLKKELFENTSPKVKLEKAAEQTLKEILNVKLT